MSPAPPPAHPFLDHPGVLAFAHRGGALEAPENTLPAFQEAVDLGYRYLETDVHCTRDGVLVAFHDSALDRVTDRAGPIEAMDWAEVRRARVAGREPIPLLEDLLAAFPHARFNIDPKSDRAVAPLAEVLLRTASLERVCVGSFSGTRLRRLQALLGPGLCRSAGPGEVARLRLSSLGLPGRRIAAGCVQVPVRRHGVRLIDRRLVAAAHRAGLQVHVWTVDEPGEMERLIDLGVDGLMTDRPAVLKAVLQRRGLWA